MGLKSTILTAPGDRFFDEIRDELLVKKQFEEQRTRNLRRVWYDTFDSRLRRSGLIIEQVIHAQEHWILLRKLGTGELCFKISLQKPAMFYDDLPAGVFRNKLQGLIKYRALLPVASTDNHNTELLLPDSEGKAILRLELETMHNSHQARKTDRIYIWLRPVRGHETVAKKLSRYLGKSLGFRASDIDPMLLAQPSSTFFPENYSAKVAVEIKPDERADKAIARVLRQLLKIKKLNEQGMLKKLDTEFLHDFRIAIRQSRSLLAQIGDVYSARQVKRLLKDFAWLSERTSDLRDYDVFLLKFERYEKELRWDMREHLAPLRSYLKTSQERSQAQLVRTLSSARYRKFMQAWEELIQAPEKKKTRRPDGKRKVKMIADRTIWRMYRKLIRQGCAITDQSPIDDLHELRKTGKKLRYSIECFVTLYEKRHIGQVIEELTRLQDVLGNLTDLDVQKNLLAKWAREMEIAHVGDEQDLNAIHTLEHILARREDKKKQKFVACFTEFADDKNRKLFKKLFANKAA